MEPVIVGAVLLYFAYTRYNKKAKHGGGALTQKMPGGRDLARFGAGQNNRSATYMDDYYKNVTSNATRGFNRR